ncbi:MAG: 2-phospho-L-lactate guanylyltransferase [Candidatus Methanofastidiosum methylothiophilum]|uniref:2-phospho-L-lactate guanylyltransferase n=1 Tax=Candidatus Methanofastidiosum methylothiophilum TaxID=1705564 RepID=A0A150IPW6_9EURY|nr:MAG: 2-phospho-L-lactate guanylyltransferase [Candidatus Methanofastidiosum methylthiophilus]KYC47000.1 MAG: 2-phospho-L-lactate guanylyltransferase [Candidatus Methanofastidiosum methylthiophilus]KYC49383.1 MAG: 2-phospho-L-lactate guanylyltransferase [Candidatus Methanofastidiosum methylthiophilus]
MTLPVILPLKYVNFSKSRLNEILGNNKKNLVIALLEDMILLLQKFPEIEVYLLTKKENVDIIPKELGVRTIFEDERDLNRALEKGVSFLKGKEKKVLILPLDLPFINEKDIQNLIYLSKDQGGAISPSSRDGTSAIIVPLDRKFRLHFGERSFQKHLSEFEKNKIPVQIHYSESLYYDLDTPEDVMRVLTIKMDSKTYSLLKDIIPQDYNCDNLIAK